MFIIKIAFNNKFKFKVQIFWCNKYVAVSKKKSEKNEQKINDLKIMRFYHVLKNFSIGLRIFNKYGNYATNFLNNNGVANILKLMQWEFVKLCYSMSYKEVALLASAKSSRVIFFVQTNCQSVFEQI